MVDSVLRDQLISLGTSTLYEAQGRLGALPAAIRPVWRGACVVGPAFTVLVRPGDNLALHHAVAQAASGDVIVAHCGGYEDSGVWGEVLTIAALQRGIAGLVVEGSVRDVDRIEALGFPIFSRGVSMGGTTKDDPGTLGSPLVVGATKVSPGDMVVGDADGVMTIARAEIGAVVQLAQERDNHERTMMGALAQGKTTIELMGLRPPAKQETSA